MLRLLLNIDVAHLQIIDLLHECGQEQILSIFLKVLSRGNVSDMALCRHHRQEKAGNNQNHFLNLIDCLTVR